MKVAATASKTCGPLWKASAFSTSTIASRSATAVLSRHESSPTDRAEQALHLNKKASCLILVSSTLTAPNAPLCLGAGKNRPIGRKPEMTLSTTTLLGLLKQQKYAFFSGVPCSNFADLFEQASLDRDIASVPAANEGS